MALPVLFAEGCGCEHLVKFYETERFLVDTVSRFVASALMAGDAAIVIATATHRSAFAEALCALRVGHRHRRSGLGRSLPGFRSGRAA
jgi:hypothetical protein